MKESSVSVIIPAYNASKTIERTVRSVARQTKPPAELIIVDDASADFESLKDTLHAIQLPEHTKLITHHNEKNMNGAGSRNIGIQLATSDYIAFLDADDEWEPEKVEISLKTLSLVSDPAIAYSKVGVFHGDTKIEERPNRGLGNGEHVSEYLFLSGGFIQTSTLVCRRKVASDILFNPEFRRHQDYDFCLRAGHSGIKFIYIDQPLVRYSSVSNLFSDRVEESDYSIWWGKKMRPYMSYFGYHGFLLFALSGRLMAQGRHIRALTNAAIQATMLGPLGLWKARSKFGFIFSKILASKKHG